MKAGAAGRVGPDDLAGGVDLLIAVGEIEAEIYSLVDFERRVALDGGALFADVDDLVQVEHRGYLGFAR